MNSMKFIKLIVGIFCLAMFSLPVATADQVAPASMYDALGGKPAITKVVDDFIGIVAADDRINFQFATTDIDRLKLLLGEQFCAALGGGCEYTGRNMKDAHEGMNVTNAQFNALAEDLYQSLEKNGVPYHTQNVIMALMAPMSHDIVTK